MADPIVLFVDDEPNILSTLRRLCRRERFQVLTATSGSEALEILAKTPAQVIISDFRMPEMTGVEFLAKAKLLVPDSIRIVLSGFADTQSVVEAINKGEIFRFLGKPWEDHELLATIHQSFEHHDLRRHNRELQERLQAQNEQLEELVAERTRSLSFSQEVLEQLPVAVLGVSREGEIMVSNASFQASMTGGNGIDPGTEIQEILPAGMASRVRECLAGGRDLSYESTERGQSIQVTITNLRAAGVQRGCVVVLHCPQLDWQIDD